MPKPTVIKDKAQSWTPKKSLPEMIARREAEDKNQPDIDEFPQPNPVLPSSIYLSPDMTQIDLVLHAQDVYRLQGINDTIFEDLLANPNFTSHSDSETGALHDADNAALSDENALVLLVDGQVQGILLHGAQRHSPDASLEYPTTPPDLGGEPLIQIPPRLLRRQYRQNEPDSPPFTRSRVALSNSFDILSTQ